MRDFVSFPLQALWGAVLFRRQPKEGFWQYEIGLLFFLLFGLLCASLFRRLRRTDGVGSFWRGYTYKVYSTFPFYLEV